MNGKQRLSEVDNVNAVQEDKMTAKGKMNLLLAVHFTNVIYSAAFWINIGIYPYVTKSIGVDTITYGYLQTIFAVLQLLGGPVFGRLGDVFGSQAALVLANSCGVAMYFMLSVASSSTMLYLSRLPGLLLHGAQGAQMVVTDLTTHKGRATALGQLSFSYGAGVVLGPFLGGQISKYSSPNVALMFAAGMSLFAVIFVYTSIPVFTKPSESKQESSKSLLDSGKMRDLMMIPGVGFIYVIKLISGLPLGIFQSMFGIIAANTFGFTAAQNGTFMSYIGLLMIIMQGFAVGFVAQRINEKNALVLSMVSSSLGYLIWNYSTSAIHLYIMVVPLVFGGALFGVITNSMITKLVPPQDTGFALGMSFAMHSLVRTISPTLGGILLASYGYTSIGSFGCVVCLASAVYIVIQRNILNDSNS